MSAKAVVSAANTGSEGTEKKPNAVLRILSSLLDRASLARRAGLRFGDLRDFYAVFGWKTELQEKDLLAKYMRQDIVSRIVDAPPGATWARPPIMTVGPTESWVMMAKKHGLYQVLHRADRLSRLNRYSLILMGYDDGSFQTPLNAGRAAKELLYARPTGSNSVHAITLNKNERDPRFGKPEMYIIDFDDPEKASMVGDTAIVAGSKRLTVHWSRLVHIVDNPLEDMVIGNPIVEKCFNLLDDLMKVSGGTAEAYWLTANRGLQADIDPETELDPADAKALSDEMDEYQHQLRRILRTRGVTLNDLGSTAPKPKDTFDMIMALLSGTTGIPRRILLGAEAGQLASEQDRANWAERIEERRVLQVEPYILNPMVRSLQMAGLLDGGEEEEGIEWEWPSAFIQNPLEEGQTMAQIARTVGNISRQTGAQTPMQLLSEEEARGVLGFEGTIPDKDRFVPPAPELDTGDPNPSIGGETAPNKGEAKGEAKGGDGGAANQSS